MPTTPVYDLPYPGPGDPDNVPVDLFALAGRLEEILDDVQASKLTSGVYTPTLTATTNVASAAPHQHTWIRVGDIVTVDGEIDIDPTAAGIAELNATLPIVSDLLDSTRLSGLASEAGSTRAGTVTADPIANAARISVTAVSGTAFTAKVHFAYQVV